MREEVANRAILECSLKYIFATEEDNSREGRLELTSETLAITPMGGAPLSYALREITDIQGADYRVTLTMLGGETLTLFHLGYTFEDFLRELSHHRNLQISSDLLMQESVRLGGMRGSYSISRGGELKAEGTAEPRLMKTALLLMPDPGNPWRIPYSDITKVDVGSYILTLTTGSGETLTLSMMGRDFDPFVNKLNEIMAELMLMAQAYIREIAPQASPDQIRRAAHLMREGKAAHRQDLEAISPDLWNSLEQRLEVMGIRSEYDFLSKFANQKRVCIGFKKGLMGDLSGDYIWFLIPLYGDSLLGNAIAMEAAGSGGRATYFFRMISRTVYNNTDSASIDRAADCLLNKINQCMLAINFRREPIYLPLERLAEPRYERYRPAITGIPALGELRELFIGRVFHRSQEQWQQDVSDLLKFNTGTLDDSVRWSKANAPDEPGLEDE